MLQNTETLFSWIARALVLFTAMPIHECAHGFTAYRLGDDTARKQGRLTLNPLVHLDVLGGLLLVFTGFGWAKPVIVDPRNFKKPKRDMALTSLAGPMSNIILALVVMVVYKVVFLFWPVLRNVSFISTIVILLSIMITTNLYLAVFNLLPVPPLDGAKIFGAILPERYYFFVMRYERYIAGILLLLLLFTQVLTIPLAFLSSGLLRALNWITLPLGDLFG